ncbi:squalene/phytoene synthase family protein [Sphingomonas sp. SUN019]|uniref:squalene/phytoene synthase family protein n=1 Tax=Sphingomonas sp. SUN019 TaxID=2937788 RepID=UPI002164D51B|nr:squalene/phytoene synthase family protein [Sphingomonas sp. SUN019]UVO49144.1 squalene/phytoene synthase family protein [Sphingomonas sp. SUN019]
MVNDAVTFGIDPAAGHPERMLALSYAPADRRRTLAALFALDATLAKLALGTREPLVAQMRLTWWYEALSALSAAAPPAQPILRVLQAAQVDGEALAAMIEGWERLLDEPDEAALRAFAVARAGLFRVAGDLLGASDLVEKAGQGWALADLARITARPETRASATRLATPLLASACKWRWSGTGRPLGALAHSARMDLVGHSAPGSPARVGRLAWHRLTGR